MTVGSEREYLYGSKRRKVSANEGKNQNYLIEHKDTKAQRINKNWMKTSIL